MRKTLIAGVGGETSHHAEETWLNVESMACVEVTSEHWNFPVEAVFIPASTGWRAAEPGRQIIRLIFDQPITLHRIRLEFRETERDRTQEFSLRWASSCAGPFAEVVRQQWNFSPAGATMEIEDYTVTLSDVRVLELILQPDLGSGEVLASLTRWQLA